MVKIALSDRLRERKWTQSELVRRTGIRPNTLGDMYHEVATRVKLDYLNRICQALDCGVGDILERTPNKEPRINPPEGKDIPKEERQARKARQSR